MVGKEAQIICLEDSLQGLVGRLALPTCVLLQPTTLGAGLPLVGVTYRWKPNLMPAHHGQDARKSLL